MKLSKLLVFLGLSLLSLSVLAKPNCDLLRDDDLLCTACNIYQEAAVEPYLGQLGVAYVTSNRRLNESYPNSFCEVVWQYKYSRGKAVAQFSWTKDGLSDKVRSEKTWQRALAIARKFALPKEVRDEMCPQIEATRRMREYLKEEYGLDRTNLPPATCELYEANLRMKLLILGMSEPDPTHGATNYHAIYVNPKWASDKTMVKTKKINLHVFYVDTRIAPKPKNHL